MHCRKTGSAILSRWWKRTAIFFGRGALEYWHDMLTDLAGD